MGLVLTKLHNSVAPRGILASTRSMLNVRPLMRCRDIMLVNRNV